MLYQRALSLYILIPLPLNQRNKILKSNRNHGNGFSVFSGDVCADTSHTADTEVHLLDAREINVQPVFAGVPDFALPWKRGYSSRTCLGSKMNGRKFFDGRKEACLVNKSL